VTGVWEKKWQRWQRCDCGIGDEDEDDAFHEGFAAGRRYGCNGSSSTVGRPCCSVGWVEKVGDVSTRQV